jgi:hypothetical protein
MCLFCSMTRRQVFRGIAAVAVGGAAQAMGSAGVPSRLSRAMGLAVLAAADLALTSAAAAEAVTQLYDVSSSFPVVSAAHWGANTDPKSIRIAAAPVLGGLHHIYRAAA